MYARKHWHIVLCGCVGGILPNLLDLAGQLINQDLGKWYSDTADIFLALLAPFLAYLIYFGVGGFITMVFKETNPMKAVVLGVSAPALIAGWLSGGAPEAAPVRLGELFGVSTAYAEDHLRLPEDHHRVRVGFIIPERLEAKHGLKYKLIDQSGKALGFGTLGGPGKTTVKVPAAGSMIIFGDAVNPKILAKLQPDEVYLLGLERNYWNDFKRALGARYKEPYDLTLQRVEKGT